MYRNHDWFANKLVLGVMHDEWKGLWLMAPELERMEYQGHCPDGKSEPVGWGQALTLNQSSKCRRSCPKIEVALFFSAASQFVLHSARSPR